VRVVFLALSALSSPRAVAARRASRLLDPTWTTLALLAATAWLVPCTLGRYCRVAQLERRLRVVTVIACAYLVATRLQSSIRSRLHSDQARRPPVHRSTLAPTTSRSAARPLDSRRRESAARAVATAALTSGAARPVVRSLRQRRTARRAPVPLAAVGLWLLPTRGGTAEIGTLLIPHASSVFASTS